MAPRLAEVSCPRCAAPTAWDGKTHSFPCPYCGATILTDAAPAPAAHGSAPQGRGAIVVVAVFVVLVGAGVATVTLRAGSTGPKSATAAPVAAVAPQAKPKAATPTPSAELLVFGEEGEGPGQLSDTRRIAVDLDENVFVATYSSARVQKFDAAGKFQWVIEVPKDKFSGSTNIFGLAVDTKGTLWVSRTGDLLKYSAADGKPLGAIKGNYDTAWFRYVAVDMLGNVGTTHFAAGHSDLLLLDPTGKEKLRVKDKEPAGLAIDSAGNLYLTDQFDGVVEVLDTKGQVKARFGSKKDPHTAGASQIAVDGKGRIFLDSHKGISVLDSGGGYLGSIRTQGGVRDLTVSAKGNLFVLAGNAKVRKYAVVFDPE